MTPILFCDGCCARAKVTVGKKGSESLNLCGHHFWVHGKALYADGWLVLDNITPVTASTTAPVAPAPVKHRAIRR